MNMRVKLLSPEAFLAPNSANIVRRPGLAWTRLERLQRFPRRLSWIKGPTYKGRRGEGKRWEDRRDGWDEREGRGGDISPPVNFCFCYANAMLLGCFSLFSLASLSVWSLVCMCIVCL